MRKLVFVICSSSIRDKFNSMYFMKKNVYSLVTILYRILSLKKTRNKVFVI